jgi:predicted kinase
MTNALAPSAAPPLPHNLFKDAILAVHILFGPQGAGKTTFARKKIAATHGATVFSVDDWMASLYLPGMPQPIDLHWILARVDRCRERIWNTSLDIVRHGGSVVLALGMQTASDRRAARSLIEQSAPPNSSTPIFAKRCRSIVSAA